MASAIDATSLVSKSGRNPGLSAFPGRATKPARHPYASAPAMSLPLLARFRPVAAEDFSERRVQGRHVKHGLVHVEHYCFHCWSDCHEVPGVRESTARIIAQNPMKSMRFMMDPPVSQYVDADGFHGQVIQASAQRGLLASVVLGITHSRQ